MKKFIFASLFLVAASALGQGHRPATKLMVGSASDRYLQFEYHGQAPNLSLEIKECVVPNGTPSCVSIGKGIYSIEEMQQARTRMHARLIGLSFQRVAQAGLLACGDLLMGTPKLIGGKGHDVDVGRAAYRGAVIGAAAGLMDSFTLGSGVIGAIAGGALGAGGFIGADVLAIPPVLGGQALSDGEQAQMSRLLAAILDSSAEGTFSNISELYSFYTTDPKAYLPFDKSDGTVTVTTWDSGVERIRRAVLKYMQ